MQELRHARPPCHDLLSRGRRSGPFRTGADRDADDLLHRHRGRTVDALRRPGRRVAAGRHRQCRRARSRTHRRDAAHARASRRSITCGPRITTAITSARCSSSRSSSRSAHFYDHGTPHPNDRIVSAQFLSAYESLSAGKRTIVKPGDKVKMTGLDITAVASANQFIRTNLPGGGSRNAVVRGRDSRRTRAPTRIRTTASQPGSCSPTAAFARSISAISPGTASSI